jgi:hypothetical protein
MQNAISRITLDVHKAVSQVSLVWKRSDTARTIEAILYDNGKPFQLDGCKVSFTTVGDNPILHNCDVTDDRIIYDAAPIVTETPRTLLCEFRVVGGDGEILTAPRFTIEVRDTVIDPDVVEGEETEKGAIGTLDALISEATGLINEVEAKLGKGEFKGDPGKSAYQYAVEAGYPDSEEQFADDLANVGNTSGGGGDVNFSKFENITSLDPRDAFIVYDTPEGEPKKIAWEGLYPLIKDKLDKDSVIAKALTDEAGSGYVATIPELEENAEIVITKDLENYLSANDLSAAIDAALAEAKASGEFDGADGKDGSVWWFINRYIDGASLNMVSDDAKDGDYCLHVTEGHVYYAKDGKWKQIGNIKGAAPIKGKDYFTEADKEEIVGELADAAPVRSVNGKTGAVNLAADDVGARPSTWTPTYTDVGAEKSGTAASAVSTHNTKADAHNDIRLLISGLSSRLDALANSDDDTLDQMAEVVAYIKANRDLIEQITTGKVSVADIVNNLTTNVANKPLSAAQGVALKALIDAISVPTKLSQLSNDAGYIKSTELNSAVDDALTEAKKSGEFDGKDGHTPVITVTPTTDGYWIAADGEDICFIRNGSDGNDGTGIYSIERTNGTGAAGTVDTYTITLTDGRTANFTVYNGKDGAKGDQYTLTDADKMDIAEQVLTLIPNGNEVAY